MLELTDDVRESLLLITEKFKYRPLPKYIKNTAYELYNANLNDFDTERQATINGVLFCNKFNRVVVGDYGAFLEIDESDLLVELIIPESQKWRYDIEYLKRRELNIKYRWLEYKGLKVYHQVATVKYADYLPNMFYISVLDFDTLS
jgi:hypothetical protein